MRNLIGRTLGIDLRPVGSSYYSSSSSCSGSLFLLSKHRCPRRFFLPGCHYFHLRDHYALPRYPIHFSTRKRPSWAANSAHRPCLSAYSQCETKVLCRDFTRDHHHERQVFFPFLLPRSSKTAEEVDEMVVVYLVSPYSCRPGYDVL